jgi:uncharacterized protein (TIGR03067 family)
MRARLFIGVVIAFILATQTQSLRGDPDEPLDAERIARLIKQLGDDDFDKREAASKALDAIGELALAALRIAQSSDDAEVHRRAEAIIQAIQRRITNRELEKLQGTWRLITDERDGIRSRSDTHVVTFKGNRWSLRISGELFQAGTVERIEVEGRFNAIDLLVTEGNDIGTIFASIYVLDGGSLKYINGNPRPTVLKTKPGDGRVYLTFRRAKP